MGSEMCIRDRKIGSPVEVYAHKFSKSAKESIEKAGGKVINL